MNRTTKIIIAVLVVAAIVAAAIIYLPQIDFSARALYDWYKNNMTYWVIILLMAIESSIIPLPSEVVVPPAAYFALQDGSDLNVFMVIVMATIGATLGAIINYALSMVIGRPIIYGFADSKVGHMFMLNSEKLEKAEAYFQKKGSISIFLGRLLPAVRHLISIPAGLAKMNFMKFSVFTLLGAAIWNIVLAAFGYLLYLAVPNENQLFDALEHYNSYIKIAGYGLIALIVLYIIYKVYKSRKQKSAQ